MYAKLFSSITESSLWSEPKEVRLLFVTMLAKADQTGFVEASVPGLARVANLTVEETVAALSALQHPDTFSKNPDHEGRRITTVPGGFMLLNYEDYRSRRNVAERQEYMRRYMREYRKHSVNNVNDCKPPLAHTDTDTDTEAFLGDAGASPAVAATATAKPRKRPQKPKPPFDEVLTEFVRVFNRPAEWTESRRKQLNARWSDASWRERWAEAMERASQSAFANGGGDRGWVMDLESFLRRDTVTKILEGKYDDREIVQPQRLTANQQRESVTANSFALIRQAAAEQAAISASGSLGHGASGKPGAIVLGETNGRVVSTSG